MLFKFAATPVRLPKPHEKRHPSAEPEGGPPAPKRASPPSHKLQWGSDHVREIESEVESTRSASESETETEAFEAMDVQSPELPAAHPLANLTQRLAEKPENQSLLPTLIRNILFFNALADQPHPINTNTLKQIYDNLDFMHDIAEELPVPLHPEEHAWIKSTQATCHQLLQTIITETLAQLPNCPFKTQLTTFFGAMDAPFKHQNRIDAIEQLRKFTQAFTAPIPDHTQTPIENQAFQTLFEGESHTDTLVRLLQIEPGELQMWLLPLRDIAGESSEKALKTQALLNTVLMLYTWHHERDYHLIKFNLKFNIPPELSLITKNTKHANIKYPQEKYAELIRSYRGSIKDLYTRVQNLQEIKADLSPHAAPLAAIHDLVDYTDGHLHLKFYDLWETILSFTASTITLLQHPNATHLHTTLSAITTTAKTLPEANDEYPTVYATVLTQLGTCLTQSIHPLIPQCRATFLAELDAHPFADRALCSFRYEKLFNDLKRKVLSLPFKDPIHAIANQWISSSKTCLSIHLSEHEIYTLTVKYPTHQTDHNSAFHSLLPHAGRGYRFKDPFQIQAHREKLLAEDSELSPEQLLGLAQNTDTAMVLINEQGQILHTHQPKAQPLRPRFILLSQAGSYHRLETTSPPSVAGQDI